MAVPSAAQATECCGLSCSCRQEGPCQPAGLAKVVGADRELLALPALIGEPASPSPRGRVEAVSKRPDSGRGPVLGFTSFLRRTTDGLFPSAVQTANCPSLQVPVSEGAVC